MVHYFPMNRPLIVDAPTSESQRVSLRWESADGASDVVGHVVAANTDWVVVLPQDRPAVWVPQAEARNLRRVPERTVLPTSSADSLQRILDRTWPGTRRARLGGWILRDGPDDSFRANSVLASGDPGVEFDEALRLVREWQGGPVRLQVVIGSDAQARGRAAGMKLSKLTRTMTLAIDDRWAVETPDAAIDDAPNEAWLELWDHRDNDARVAEMTAAPATYLRLGDHAIGRIAYFGGWGVLTDVEVARAARGRGLGRDVTNALLAHAARAGVRYLALQVEQTNNIAVALYESLGFTEHHRYGYLSERA